MPQLVVPRRAVVASFVSSTVVADDDQHPDYDRVAAERAAADPAGYVEGLVGDTREDAPRPEGFVPSTHLWWVEDEQYLGRLQIRHRLTAWLREIGGHVGYRVVPGHRRQGHATAMLAAALPVAFALGIESALITCDEDNVGSRLVIERNGGLFRRLRNGKRHYLVPTYD